MKRIAIIGGGISGLSAAYTLEEKRRAGTQVEYVLFESKLRLGGVIVTERVDGCLVEAGPDSFLSEKPWAADLCTRLGLGDQLVGSNDSQRKTYIAAKNKLTEMPDGLMFMVPTKIMPAIRSPLFSLRTKIRMAAEWFRPPRKTSEDETVAEMVERHYGPEMVEILADPLLSGVYGGEASQLSVRAALPRLTAISKYPAEPNTAMGSPGIPSPNVRAIFLTSLPFTASLMSHEATAAGGTSSVVRLVIRLPNVSTRSTTPLTALPAGFALGMVNRT